MEDFPSRRGGASLTTDPLLWTLRAPKCSKWNREFLAKKKLPPYDDAFDAILKKFGRYFQADPSAERWQSG